MTDRQPPLPPVTDESPATEMTRASWSFDPEDIPIADGYSRDDFGTPDEVRGWNLCREYVIAMLRGER